MDADVNKTQPCQCELCQPNWFMGSGGDFVPQPVAEVRQVVLEEAHIRKLHLAQREADFAPVTG